MLFSVTAAGKSIQCLPIAGPKAMLLVGQLGGDAAATSNEVTLQHLGSTLAAPGNFVLEDDEKQSATANAHAPLLTAIMQSCNPLYHGNSRQSFLTEALQVSWARYLET